jgi:hypothetical protein
MQKYIIISIIIAIIIFLFYKKINIKNDRFEHFYDFEVYSEESLNNINKLSDAYSKLQNIATFDKLISKNITAQSINTHSIIKLGKSKSDYGVGDVLRYNAVDNTFDNINTWINSPPVRPQWTTMVIYGTLKPIIKTPYTNLLNKESYSFSQGNSTVLNLADDSFNFPSKTDGSNNKFYSFNGPFNDKLNLTGLRYDPTLSSIVGFDPKKLYKIDCTISLYNLIGYDGWSKVDAIITDVSSDESKLKIFGSTTSAAHHNGMTVVLRVGCYKTDIPWSGIQLSLQHNLSDGKRLYFWNYAKTDDHRPHPSVNVTISVEEIRKGL